MTNKNSDETKNIETLKMRSDYLEKRAEQMRNNLKKRKKQKSKT